MAHRQIWNCDICGKELPEAKEVNKTVYLEFYTFQNKTEYDLCHYCFNNVENKIMELKMQESKKC